MSSGAMFFIGFVHVFMVTLNYIYNCFSNLSNGLASSSATMVNILSNVNMFPEVDLMCIPSWNLWKGPKDLSQFQAVNCQ